MRVLTIHETLFYVYLVFRSFFNKYPYQTQGGAVMSTTYDGPERRAYTGPERRSVITFTREDSERLVRVEQQVAEMNQRLKSILESINDQTKRINDLERSQSWLWGLGSAFAFISTAVVIFLKTHLF